MNQLRHGQILRWMAALMTLVLAGALCLACLDLYRTGIAPENLTPEGVRIHDIYTWENVGQKLAQLLPVAVVWLLLVILAALLPKEAERRPGMDPENALRLLRPRVEQTPAMAAQQSRRRLCRLATGALAAVCLVYIARYMTDARNFTSWDLEMVMGQMARHVAWPAALVVLGLCVCQVLLERSYRAEWEAAKQAPKRREPIQMAAPREFPTGVARVVLAAAAVALLAAGVRNGGMYDVLVKAINICTECIGLG